MKLEEIKSAIIKKLKDIKKISLEYADGSDYDNLQEMIKKTIVVVTEVENVSDIESISIYLETIEDYYNKCRGEVLCQDSKEQLFDFDFDLGSAAGIQRQLCAGGALKILNEHRDCFLAAGQQQIVDLCRLVAHADNISFG